MQKPETSLSKPDKGWTAKSVIALPGIVERVTGNDTPGQTVLEIETSKPPFKGPGIVTRASVVHKTEYGYRCSISYGQTYAESGGDYSRRVRADTTARATEKKIATYHNESLDYYETILEDVALHYGKTVAELFEPATEPLPEPA